ncbi:MAG: DinB family protein [Acidobacteria bacterium]|nr:DinB family protein [Acidobacteriota bacterium]
MDNRIIQVELEVDSITADIDQKFGELTSAQINWKPSAESWSVGQCLDHLIKTSEIYSVDINSVAKGTRGFNFLERFSPLSGFFGKLLIKAMDNDEKKVKTSDRFVPPSNIDANVVGLFRTSQEDLKETVRGTEHLDWKKTILTSSFMKIVTYSLADAFTIITKHQRRHMRQAERVMKLEQFPGRG